MEVQEVQWRWAQGRNGTHFWTPRQLLCNCSPVHGCPPRSHLVEIQPPLLILPTKGRKEEQAVPSSCTDHFLLHPIGQNVVTWQYIPARDTRKCSLDSRWPSVHLKSEDSVSTEKWRMAAGSTLAFSAMPEKRGVILLRLHAELKAEKRNSQ